MACWRKTGGDISGIFMFLISEPTQVMLEQLLPVEAGAYDELASSAIARWEISCAVYINALPAGLRCGGVGAGGEPRWWAPLLSVPIIYLRDHSDNLLLIENGTFIDDQSVSWQSCLLPNLELKRIFSAVENPMADKNGRLLWELRRWK